MLNATIRYHLSTYPGSPTITELQANLYVDDRLTGCDYEHEVYIRATEALDILKTAGLSLTKWCSNGSFASARLQSFNDKISGSDVLKVLGLSWNASTDEFLVAGKDFVVGLCLIKWVVLGFIARLFEPLGVIFPFTITA